MATYTRLTGTDLATLLGRYGITRYRPVPLAGGHANSSFLIRTAPACYVLTVLDNHDEASAGRLTALLNHLAAHDLPVGRPVPDHNGAVLSRFRGRPVVVKHYLPGDCRPVLPRQRLRPAGRLLARVHAVPVPPCLPVGRRRLPANWAAQAARFTDRGLVDWLHEQLTLAAPVDGLEEPRGLVHGDFFPDNLVVGPEERLAVLDWETATDEVLVRDIGASLVGCCRVDGGFDPDRATDFLSGYQEIRPLWPREREALLPAARYASAFIAYHRYLRHHILRPDPAKQSLYREMLRFVESLEAGWAQVVTAVCA